MSTKKKLLEAAAGATAGEALYVDDVFSTFLYEGTDPTNQTITNNIDLDGEGGLVWIKGRDTTYDHALYDTERGVYKYLESNQTGAEASNTTHLRAFNSNGFDIGVNLQINTSGSDYVSWTFRKAPKFFDVVTYTGDGSTTNSIAHSLDSLPGFIVVKRTDSTSDWHVVARYEDTNYMGGGSTNSFSLNTTDIANNGVNPSDRGITTISFDAAKMYGGVGSFDVSKTNASGATYVAYLFAHNDGDGEFGEDGDQDIIKCGSYTGNGATAAVEVDLGFEPQWVLIKNATSSGGAQNWHIIDSMRGWPAATSSTQGGTTKVLKPNLSNAEESNAGYYGWITSNGFSVYETNVSNPGTAYIYMAIRRPHKPASEFAATDLFGMDSETPPSGNVGSWSAGFVTDMALKLEEALANHDINSRLTGTEVMYTDTTNAGGPYAINKWDYQKGFGDAGTSSAHKKALFRRAPGFFDVVAYTGDGVAGRTVAHNLGVVPEMMWIKKRSGVYEWIVYSPAGDGYLRLNTTEVYSTNNFLWNATNPTATNFTLSGFTHVNGTGETYIAYLFSTVAGVSKVGSYTGTGANLNVDCGFSAGARFILIRRTDSTGDWYVWNYSFGIVAGNDPYSLLNTTAAPVTNTDYIDPLSSGFTVTSSAPAALNASGGSYIFYAIA